MAWQAFSCTLVQLCTIFQGVPWWYNLYCLCSCSMWGVTCSPEMKFIHSHRFCRVGGRSIWWESGKQVKASMWLQNRRYSNQNRIFTEFRGRSQRNLTYQMGESYHLIIHTYIIPSHVDLGYVLGILQSLELVFHHVATYFCIDLLEVIFQSPHFGLLPNEMGCVFMLFIHICLLHTIPNTFFLI